MGVRKIIQTVGKSPKTAVLTPHVAQSPRARALAQSTTIMLKPFPPWTSPSDIRRMAERAQVDGIRNVILHYDEYINFTGEAFIKFPSALLAREATQKLKDSQFSAIPLERPVLVVDGDVKPSPTPPTPPTPQKASHLPSSINFVSQPASVLITGVPYTWTHPNFLSYLDAFRPEFLDAPEESVTRITVETKVTCAGRWLVKLASIAEAHRIARHVNLAKTRTLRRDEQDQTMFERRTLTCTVIY